MNIQWGKGKDLGAGQATAAVVAGFVYMRGAKPLLANCQQSHVNMRGRERRSCCPLCTKYRTSTRTFTIRVRLQLAKFRSGWLVDQRMILQR